MAGSAAARLSRSWFCCSAAVPVKEAIHRPSPPAAATTIRPSTSPWTKRISDVDGDQVTFTWSAVRGTVTSSGPTATSATFTAAQQWGVVTVTVTASDGKGGSAQATAQSYIRNPSPPSLAVSAGAPTFPQCTGFVVQVTPAEAISVTNLFVHALDVPAGCDYSRDFSASPVSIPSGQTGALRGQGVDCIWDQCAGDPVSRYAVTIQGRRPEPDGGTFAFTCPRFDPSDGSCN
jgi:hypothetical protein